MKQNEKRTEKGVLSIEEYLRKIKNNKNIYPKKAEKEKSSVLVLTELYMWN